MASILLLFHVRCSSIQRYISDLSAEGKIIICPFFLHLFDLLIVFQGHCIDKGPDVEIIVSFVFEHLEKQFFNIFVPQERSYIYVNSIFTFFLGYLFLEPRFCCYKFVKRSLFERTVVGQVQVVLLYLLLRRQRVTAHYHEEENVD